ncbi:MAG: DUF4476 domain-containing protein [Ginsengibacter sp.]
MLICQIKKLVFVLLVMLFTWSAEAQQDRFVYLQTDNGKPFYVRMDRKIISSSSEGYVILHNVTNGTYQINVGFPKNEYPEERFTVSVDNRNQGFLIKHFDDKGLQLFNLETLALISGDKDTSSTAVAVTQENNEFTRMLATVVQDSSILQNHDIVINNSSKPDDTMNVATQKDSSTESKEPDHAIANSSPTPLNDNKPAADSNEIIATSPEVEAKEVPSEDSSVSKILSKKDQNGLQLIYADNSAEAKDTVRVFMPSAKNETDAGSKATNNPDFNLANQNQTESQPEVDQLTITPTKIDSSAEKSSGFVLRKDSLSNNAAAKSQTAPEQVFYIGPKEKPKDTGAEKEPEEKKGLFSGFKNTNSETKERDKAEKKPANKIEVLPKVVTASTVNSDCKSFADNEDFLRLRKKMASEDNKEDMIKAAKKYFKSKCFSTAQIKDLSYLFLTDEGKYMFFDAAYAHTSDSDQYATLESEIKDPYYRSRFEAMVRH